MQVVNAGIFKLVLYPKLTSFISKKAFRLDELNYFVNILENVIKEHEESQEVVGHAAYFFYAKSICVSIKINLIYR